MMYGSVFDLEGDGLKPTKLHVLSACVEPGLVASTNNYKIMRDFFLHNEALVGHNITRWDIPALEKVLEIEIPKETLIIDTLAVSWYINPKRPKHGLEGYGEDYGIKKPEVKDWEGLTYEAYKHRCEEDVRINTKLWIDQYDYLLKLYGDHDAVVTFLKYLAFKMDCAREQERSRWKLDINSCQTSLAKLEGLQKEKFDELRAAMPAVGIKGTHLRPSKPYKADGNLSVAGEKWAILTSERGLSFEHEGPIEYIRGYDEPNPNSHDQIKQWLYSLGWEPETFKTNKKGVDVPQINKAKQDGGGICESIVALYPKEPRLELLDRLFVLGHRIGILNGFLSAVSEDGYVSARVQGLTNTLRFKHAECVNLPKIDAPYGSDIRGCLVAPEGYELCGSDMSSLEDRTKQHYMWKYDPEYVKEMMTPDFDPHLDIAVVGGLMSKQDADEYKKGNYTPQLKTVRGIAKNTNYAGVYGAGAPKIAKTAGISLKEANALHKSYWQRNWSVKAVANACKTKTVTLVVKPGEIIPHASQESTWLFNPVSGFWYSLRNEKDKFSTLNQGTGVYCFDTWVAFVRAKRPQLTAQFHDEIVLCIKKGHREECTKMLKDAVKEANEFLQLNRELDVGVDYGDTYADIH